MRVAASGQVCSPDYHDMCETCVVLDMPLDRAAVGGLGVPLNASDFAVYFHGRFDEVALIIGDAG